MDEKILTVEIPEEIVATVQKYDIERCARRDIIVYIMENNTNVSPERFAQYQKEYDDKYFAFEAAKSEIEKNYVRPLIKDKAANWNLDYESHIITITLQE